MRSKYTDEQRDEALRLLATVGRAEAARISGIAEGTIASWGSRHNVAAAGAEAMRPAIEAKAASLLQRKQALAEGLLDDIARLRSELFAPVLERKVVIVKGGTADPCTVAEIVDVTHTRPSPSDQKHLMVACAVAVDKVQLLTGGLTASIGVTEAPEQLSATEERERALATVHELGLRAVS
jgi:hypothetical protein